MSNFDRIRRELRPCDVLLVEGRSRISDAIKAVTQSPWSHAALYVGRLHDVEDESARRTLARQSGLPPEEQLIIESQLGYGTVVRSLGIYEDEHLRICRPQGLSGDDASQVVSYAINRLGVPYDVRQIFDLARFLIPWAFLPRQWRSSLFTAGVGDETRTVCSTMIAEAFGAVQFPILPLVQRTEDDDVHLYRRNPKLCTPSNFDYSPYFEIIKYPFVDFSTSPAYKLLPWSSDDASAPSEAAIAVHGKPKKKPG